jgi:hypothetical protein
LNSIASALVPTFIAAGEQYCAQIGSPSQKSHFAATLCSASNQAHESGQAKVHDLQLMHFMEFTVTHPVFSSLIIASAGQEASQTGFSQCWQFVASSSIIFSSTNTCMCALSGFGAP